MNVYEESHRLARAIKESEEYKQFQAIKDRVEQNPELASMIHDFESKQMAMQMKQMTGEISQQSLQQQMQEIYQIVMRDPVAVEYIQAQMRFSLMMKDVYEILGDAMGIGKPFGI